MVKLILLNANQVDTGSAEKLRRLIPEDASGEVLNFGQSEGQIRIDGTVWGLYWNPEPTLVFEEGQLSPEAALQMASRIVAQANAAWGPGIESRVVGALQAALSERPAPPDGPPASLRTRRDGGRTGRIQAGKLRASVRALVAALIVSNAWWVYRWIDSRVTVAYHAQHMAELEGALAQVLALIPELHPSEPSKQAVISAADSAARVPGDQFEKDGFLWVGDLGLRFSDDGQLVEVVPAWDQDAEAP